MLQHTSFNKISAALNHLRAESLPVLCLATASEMFSKDDASISSKCSPIRTLQIGRSIVIISSITTFILSSLFVCGILWVLEFCAAQSTDCSIGLETSWSGECVVTKDPYHHPILAEV
jgi:hypothetical protein